ncbi:MAG: hypothetical protein HRU23_16760 [Gammaproteobacteria bacterium]|nr:hypothetical protein [Gammaproteobacteria bacterium]
MRLTLFTTALLFLSLSCNAQQSDYVTPMCSQLDDPATYSDSQRQDFGRLVQGPDNWLFRLDKISPNLDIEPQALAMLSQINKLFKQRGTTLVMIPVPHRSLIYPHQIPDSMNYDFEIARQKYLEHVNKLTKSGIHTVDFTTMLNTNIPNLYYKRDFHWRPEGSRIAAQLVNDYVAKLPVYGQYERKKIESRYHGVYGLDSNNQRVFSKLCGTAYPKEYHKLYQVASTAENNEDKLFGADEGQNAVLLGTSFSENSARNFDGFLSEFLGINIINHAVSGGGLVGSITQYVNSEEFANNPAQLVLWEYPVRDLAANNFALALPKMKNASCDTNTFVESSTTLTLGSNMVAYNGGENYQQLKQHQVLYEFTFDNPKISEFSIKTHYVERRQYANKIGHSRIKGLEGHFVVDQGGNRSIKDLHFLALEINVESPELVGAKVITKVCTQESS